MTSLRIALVFTLFLASGICQDVEPSKSTSPTEPTTSKQTTVETTSIETTTRTSTTVVPTTSTTPVPTTSPSPVPTTTASPTPEPTSSTTPVPSTTSKITTTNMPITTTGPPVPEPKDTKWNVTEGNLTCIRAELKIRFKIQVEDKFEYIVLTQDASTDKSTCNATNGTQELSLVDSDFNLKMIFEKDSSSAPKAYVKEITFSYSLPPNIHGDVSNGSHLFQVNAGNSYLCNTGDVLLANVTMEVMHIRIQAFLGEGSQDFGTVEECEADNKINDLVPIVVGCALLALVVVVLIAYFVGRRRSRQKGYQSV